MDKIAHPNMALLVNPATFHESKYGSLNLFKTITFRSDMLILVGTRSSFVKATEAMAKQVPIIVKEPLSKG